MISWKELERFPARLRSKNLENTMAPGGYAPLSPFFMKKRAKSTSIDPRGLRESDRERRDIHVSPSVLIVDASHQMWHTRNCVLGETCAAECATPYVPFWLVEGRGSESKYAVRNRAKSEEDGVILRVRSGDMRTRS